MPVARRQLLQGITLMMVGALMTVITDGLVKHLNHLQLAVPQLLFYRHGFAAIFLLCVFLPRAGLNSIKTTRPQVHCLRMMFSLGSALFTVLSLKFIPLSTFIAINFSAPLVVMLVAPFILNEYVGFKRWAMVLLGFIGVLVVVRPRDGMNGIGTLFAFLTTLSWAMSFVVVRKYVKEEKVSAFSFWSMLGMSVAMIPFLPAGWMMMDMKVVLLLMACGIAAALAQLCMSGAMKKAPAPVVAPFEYSGMIWAILADIIIWQVWPDAGTVIGFAIVLVSGLLLIRMDIKKTQLN